MRTKERTRSIGGHCHGFLVNGLTGSACPCSQSWPCREKTAVVKVQLTSGTENWVGKKINQHGNLSTQLHKNQAQYKKKKKALKWKFNSKPRTLSDGTECPSNTHNY